MNNLPKKTEAQTVQAIPLDKIHPNPSNPRTSFDKGALEELADSIRQVGVLQPILVEPSPSSLRKGGEHGDQYLIQAGERRWRAARLAGLAEIPAIVRPPLNGTGPREWLVLALVENLQRSDMNAIDEAHGYQVLAQDHDLTQVEIAHQVGVPFSRVHHMLTMLKLDPGVHKYIANGSLTQDPRVVSALMDLSPKHQVAIAEGLATRKVGPKQALEVIERFKLAHREEKIAANEIPAKRMAVLREGEPRMAIWNAMAQVGKVPPWLLVEVAARDTCNNCGLRDQASPSVCRGCALVDFLAQMIRSVNHAGH